MDLGKLDKLIHIRLNRLNSSLHRRDCVALTIKPDTFSPYSTETSVCSSGSTTTMHASKVRAKDENFVLGQLCYKLWRILRLSILVQFYGLGFLLFPYPIPVEIIHHNLSNINDATKIRIFFQTAF